MVDPFRSPSKGELTARAQADDIHQADDMPSSEPAADAGTR
jgi:hypothetical protein